jgi:predicted  nucleic acid-binding Zn-ribbon protein
MIAAAQAQSRMSAVYRCEGSPPIYVSAAQAAQSRQCSNIGRLPQLAARRAAKDKVSATSKAAAAAASAPAAQRDKAPLRTVPLTLQRDRDDDRVRLLEEELARERQRLAALQRQSPRTAPGNGTEPTELSRQIQRVESDIAALTRELALAQRERKRVPVNLPGTV